MSGKAMQSANSSLDRSGIGRVTPLRWGKRPSIRVPGLAHAHRRAPRHPHTPEIGPQRSGDVEMPHMARAEAHARLDAVLPSPVPAVGERSDAHTRSVGFNEVHDIADGANLHRAPADAPAGN